MRRAHGITAALVALVMLAGSGVAAASTSSATTKKFRACLVTDTGGINDHSFNELTWNGLRAAAAADHKITASFLQSTDTADYAANISAFIAQKCGIIVTVGFLMAAATESAAKANPHRKFAIVDCTYRSECLSGRKLKNLDQIGFNSVQDAFLGGYLAAGMSKTHVVATYGGEHFGTVTIYMDGFWDGVQYYDAQHHAHVKVAGWNEKTQHGTFLGSFTDLTKGAKLTRALLKKGADVIFPVAGGGSFGTAQAVRAADASGGHAAIEWPDTDGCLSAARFCKFFLTSVTKGITAAARSVVLAGAHGRFRAEYIGILGNGGVALTANHHFMTAIPAALKTELARVKAKIESGKITPATKGVF